MDADAQTAPVAALVADATRSTILFALSAGLREQLGVETP